MSPINKLDTILKLLAEEGTLRPYATQANISEAMYPKHDIYTFVPSDITKSLEYLIDEGYVQTQFFNGDYHYYTTFNGEIFNAKGGYKTQLLQQSNKAKRANLENRILTLGAAMTGVYGLVEIIKTCLQWKPISLSINLLTASFLFCSGILVGVCIWLIAKELIRQEKR